MLSIFSISVVVMGEYMVKFDVFKLISGSFIYIKLHCGNQTFNQKTSHFDIK
jgi:hypothetical protein